MLLDPSRVVGWDTETFLVTDDEPTPRFVCHSIAPPGEAPIVSRSPEAILPWFERAARGECIIVGHNIQYDLRVTLRALPTAAKLIFAALDAGGIVCTRMQYKLIKLRDTGKVPEKGTSLADVVWEHLGLALPKDDTWRLRYGELAWTPVAMWPTPAVAYAKMDAAAVKTLAVEMGDVGDMGRQTAYDFVLNLMTATGLRVDKQMVMDQIDIEDRNICRAQEELLSIGAIRRGGTAKAPKLVKNTAIIRQAIEEYCGAEGIEPPRTLTGAVSIAEGAIRLLPDDHPLGALPRLMKAEKLIGSYYGHYLVDAKAGRPVRPYVNTLLATGRLSLRKPALQTLPRKGKVRECFIPRDGCVFVNPDLDTAELRALGQATLDTVGYSRFAELFQKDPTADPHMSFGASMLGISVEEMRRRYTAKDPVAKGARQDAKAANFGFPGGMGVARFVGNQASMGKAFPFARAQQLKDAYMAQWAEMHDYFTHVKQVVDAGGLFTLPVSQRARGRCGFCDGANNGFQARISDVSKLWCYLITKESYCDEGSPLHGCRLLLQVHDEVIVEAPASRGHEVAERVRELAEEAGRVHIPDVPMRSQPCLMERWYKAAEPVYNGDRLVPWRPNNAN